MGSIMRESSAEYATITRLRELGCSIAVTGYLREGLSINVLKQVDYVKIDGSICAGISERPDDLQLLKAAVEFARRAGAGVVGERIESQADASILAEMGVDYLQGYLFGKASPDHFHLTLAPIDAADDEVVSGAPASPPPVAIQEEVAQPAPHAGTRAVPSEDSGEQQSGEQPSAGHTSQQPGGIDLLKSALSKLDSI
jgi:EAL domain-containing protein (putative c-di-GMP-specific phosphodiesterase class I)